MDARRATIMDFEEASYYYRVFDIGMMFIGICCKEKNLADDVMGIPSQQFKQLSGLKAA